MRADLLAAARGMRTSPSSEPPIPSQEHEDPTPGTQAPQLAKTASSADSAVCHVIQYPSAGSSAGLAAEPLAIAIPEGHEHILESTHRTVFDIAAGEGNEAGALSGLMYVHVIENGPWAC